MRFAFVILVGLAIYARPTGAAPVPKKQPVIISASTNGSDDSGMQAIMPVAKIFGGDAGLNMPAEKRRIVVTPDSIYTEPESGSNPDQSSWSMPDGPSDFESGAISST